MSWHNGSTHHQYTYLERPLDRGTTTGIVQRPLDRSTAVVQICMTVGLKYGRWQVCMTFMLMQELVRVYSSCYVYARIDVNITSD